MFAFLLRPSSRVGEVKGFYGNSLLALFARVKQLPLVPWLVLLLVGLFETKAMWTPALLLGHSAWFDLTRMVELDAAIRSGDYFALWSPDLYYGYGSPLFQFYSPLAYFLTEVPVLAGIDIPTALKMVQVATLIGSGLAMYHLATGHVSRWAACFSGVLYMVAPYRMVDLFVRHALGEHVAFLWLPLIVWATEQALRRYSQASLLVGCLATAGLVLTHNITALIGLPVCVATAWILAGQTKDWNWWTLLRGVCPVAIGVGLATFFWWPALSGRIFIQETESLTAGYYDYHRHFLEAGGFVNLIWRSNDARAITNGALQIGLPHLLLGFAALVFAIRKPRKRWDLAGAAIVFGALFMCTAASGPIWATLPMLKYVQFPWRFLSLAVFGAALCGAVVFERIRATRPGLELPTFLMGLVVVLAAYFPFYTHAYFLAADARTNSLVQAAPEHVEALRANGALRPVDSIVTRDKIRAAGERTTGGDDFLPHGVLDKPTSPSPRSISTDAGEVIRSDRVAFNSYRAHVLMSEDGKLQLHQFWFPGWVATLDGRRIRVSSEGKSAIVSCDVPAGEHIVEFDYTGLPQRRFGIVVSWTALVLGAALLAGKSHQKNRTLQRTEIRTDGLVLNRS